MIVQTKGEKWKDMSKFKDFFYKIQQEKQDYDKSLLAYNKQN